MLAGTLTMHILAYIVACPGKMTKDVLDAYKESSLIIININIYIIQYTQYIHKRCSPDLPESLPRVFAFWKQLNRLPSD